LATTCYGSADAERQAMGRTRYQQKYAETTEFKRNLRKNLRLGLKENLGLGLGLKRYPMHVKLGLEEDALLSL
jgi:hypothetical protein